MTVIHSNHYSARLECGRYVLHIPGVAGRKDEKKPGLRARDSLFNSDLAKAWVRKSLGSDTRFSLFVRKNRKFFEHRVCSNVSRKASP